jgi:hypothetical protein
LLTTATLLAALTRLLLLLSGLLRSTTLLTATLAALTRLLVLLAALATALSALLSWVFVCHFIAPLRRDVSRVGQPFDPSFVPSIVASPQKVRARSMTFTNGTKSTR